VPLAGLSVSRYAAHRVRRKPRIGCYFSSSRCRRRRLGIPQRTGYGTILVTWTNINAGLLRSFSRACRMAQGASRDRDSQPDRATLIRRAPGRRSAAKQVADRFHFSRIWSKRCKVVVTISEALQEAGKQVSAPLASQNRCQT